jgi:hypothetical protein
MTFTAAELEAALEAYDPDMWWEAESIFREPQPVPVGPREYVVELVSYNSELGQDYKDSYKTNIELIFRADGRLFRKTGYHQSFTGGDWDGAFEEVREAEKTVKFYESI